MFNPITSRYVESREIFKTVVPILTANIIPTLPQFSEIVRVQAAFRLSRPLFVSLIFPATQDNFPRILKAQHVDRNRYMFVNTNFFCSV
jgi:hypothetical protein